MWEKKMFLYLLSNFKIKYKWSSVTDTILGKLSWLRFKGRGISGLHLCWPPIKCTENCRNCYIKNKKLLFCFLWVFLRLFYFNPVKIWCRKALDVFYKVMTMYLKVLFKPSRLFRNKMCMRCVKLNHINRYRFLSTLNH